MDSGCMLEMLKEYSCVEHDRISHLSEDVICKILSFVTPTKYAIRTSVLSKSWEHLWVFSPIIILEHPLGARGESDQNRVLRAISFTNSVDNLLFLRDCSPVEFFKLHFEGKFDSFGMRPSSWVCAVVMCNVRELDLQIDLDNNDLGEFPWCLFTCNTLVVLKLDGKFILNLPYRVTLPNLKILSLGWFIYIGDAEIQKLLSGCPVLEDLQILRDDFDQIWIQNVIVSSLKRLTLVSYGDSDDEQEIVYRHKIVIDAPNLEFLSLTDAWPNDIFVKTLPNIVEAHIDIGLLDLRVESEYIDKLLLLLQSIVNVRRLFLDCLTFLILIDDDELNLPRFCNLVFMEIDYSNGPYRLMEFLHSAPNLESLSFPCLYILDVPKLKDHFELFDKLNGLAAYIDGFRFPRVVCPDIDLEFRINTLKEYLNAYVIASSSLKSNTIMVGK